MRINIYEEELTTETALLVKDVPQGNGAVERFYGVRLFLESPQTILDHSTPEDDDRNAVTLWVRRDGKDLLRALLVQLSGRVESIPASWATASRCALNLEGDGA